VLKNNEVTTWGQLVIKKGRRGKTENLGHLVMEISIWQKEVSSVNENVR